MDLKVIDTIINAVLLISVIAAFIQFQAMKKANKAQALYKLIDEWRNDEIYKSVSIIHNILDQWKTTGKPTSEWNQLAKSWVDSFFEENQNGSYIRTEQQTNEWLARRKVSQLLATMGFLMKNNYIKPHELFSIIPEAGRLMFVLSLIEEEIQKREDNSNQIAAWDRRAGKWQFYYLWKAYLKWYPKKGTAVFDAKMTIPDFNKFP